jgi:hydroxyethylthiazole kinase
VGCPAETGGLRGDLANPTNLIRVMPAEGDEMHSPADLRAASGNLPRTAAAVLKRLRETPPRVHCITNSVAQAFTANVLLAAGAVPSMTISPEEVGHFAASADALLVNLGTFDRERAAAIDIALRAAADAKRPWVLDPVLIDRSPPRADLARKLLARGPSVVRLNGAEFSALAGQTADADSVRAFAAQSGAVIALSGATDLVADGTRLASISNGHALMAKVTAMGCAASALIAACLVVADDRWQAAAAGLVILGVAGEIAGKTSAGPGSFATSILDALHRLDETALIEHARIS